MSHFSSVKVHSRFFYVVLANMTDVTHLYWHLVVWMNHGTTWG